MDNVRHGWLTRVGLRPSLVVAVVLSLLWVVAYFQLSRMAREVYPPPGSGLAGLRGLVRYLAGDYGGAGRAYREGLHGIRWFDEADDPTGYLATRAGDLAEGERRAGATLARSPAEVEARVTLAEIAFDRDAMADAEAQLRKVFERVPDHLDGLYLSALVAARAGDAGRAIDALNQALRHGAVGVRDTILFRIMEAAGDLGRRAGPERPLCLLAHFHRYLRIFDNRHATIAMAYARQAVARGDHVADAYLSIGILHDKRAEHDQSLDALKRALEVNPRHAQALWWAAGEAHGVGNLVLEYESMRRAFEAAPTDAFYLPDLEDLLLKRLGDVHGFVAMLEKAVALNPANAAAHEGLARAALALGDGERARDHQERARALRSLVVGAPR